MFSGLWRINLKSQGSLRSLLGEPLDGANRLPVVAEVVARAVAAQIEAEVPRLGVVVVRVRNRRPVGASRTGMAERRPGAEAGAGKEDAVAPSC